MGEFYSRNMAEVYSSFENIAEVYWSFGEKILEVEHGEMILEVVYDEILEVEHGEILVDEYGEMILGFEEAFEVWQTLVSD